MPRFIRLDKLLSSRGYCSRSDAAELIRYGAVTVQGESPRSAALKVDPATVKVGGEDLDPGEGLLLMLNKPVGYTCSRSDSGALVYELLPERYSRRNPILSSVGRLDKETSGLLLFTDDGQVLHRLTSPKFHIPRVYTATLTEPLKGTEVSIFASGTLMLDDETKPLLPAFLEPINPTECRITLHEGRYHQVRRMFAAVGNKVESLHRAAFGSLTLTGLAEGEYRSLTPGERAAIGCPLHADDQNARPS
jgi:16S rRNA pseudouridine516 synthase